MEADAPEAAMGGKTLLLQKKRLMEEAQIELDRKKEEIRLRMLKCQENEDRLAAVQSDLRAQVVRFEKFLKDNDAKRLRMHRKALDEIRQREGKEAEIAALHSELQQLSVARDEGLTALESVRGYETFLEMVVESTDEFAEIGEVMGRHGTLASANADLNADIAEWQGQIDVARSQLAAYLMESQNEALVSNSRIAELQEQLEHARAETARLELGRGRDDASRLESQRVSVKVSLAIENLALRISRHQRRPMPEGGLAGKLHMISARLLDLQLIVEEAARTSAES